MNKLGLIMATAACVPLLASCGIGADVDRAEACQEAVAEESWTTHAQLARRGLAADPEALVEASSGLATRDGDRVDLPPYDEVRAALDEGEWATLDSALRSAQHGTGAYYDGGDSLAVTLENAGLCD